MNKENRLRVQLKKMGSLLVAFSGGADSTYLLKVASQEISREKLLAVTASSPLFQKEELMSARRWAREFDIRHRVIQTRELLNRRFSANPADRCYHCKKELFARLQGIARRSGLNFVVDASTVSDAADFRPGSIAKKELGVRSPLAEAGFRKADVRRFSRILGLQTWDKPSQACLASRLPYGEKISLNVLKQISQAEEFLRGLGFRQVRLRHYGRLCRIEVLPTDLRRLWLKRARVVDKLKKMGYNYVTSDMEGFRSGSMNEILKRGKS